MQKQSESSPLKKNKKQKPQTIKMVVTKKIILFDKTILMYKL